MPNGRWALTAKRLSSILSRVGIPRARHSWRVISTILSSIPRLLLLVWHQRRRVLRLIGQSSWVETVPRSLPRHFDVKVLAVPLGRDWIRVGLFRLYSN